MNLDGMIDEYFRLREEIHAAFGYKEDWVTIPLSDERGMHWHYKGNDRHGCIYYSPLPLTPDVLTKGDNLYSAVLYTQRFLPRWIYRTDEHTMICADTQCDGNKYLMIFENALEVKEIPEHLLVNW